ncbi:NlpC/P60 family protein [Corynebacterium sp. CCM 9203]|uniref:C40 family peptidase n=1 Tax=Corynebacterium sp. CCM 9203 TaxID=3057615 RepID=UPI0035262B08
MNPILPTLDPLAGVFSGLDTISSLLPPELHPPVLDVPDVSSASPLAEMFGTDAQQLVSETMSLTADCASFATTTVRAAVVLNAARLDLTGIATAALRDVRLVAPLVLTPNPATALSAVVRIATITGAAISAAVARVLRMEAELRPHVSRFRELAATETHLPQVVPSDGPGSAPAPLGKTFPLSPNPGRVSPSDSGAGRRAAEAALSMVGTPYVWGGSTPDGFDCSGLTSWAWRQAGVELPRLAEHQTVGRQVSSDELTEGDLVVWNGHVAMYIGNGRIVEAGSPVEISPLRTTNGGMDFYGFWRPTG